MSKLDRSFPILHAPIPETQNLKNDFRQEEQFRKASKEGSRKEEKQQSDKGDRHTGGQQKGTDASLSQRSRLFEQELAQAVRGQSTEDGNDSSGEGETVLVMFEFIQSGRNGEPEVQTSPRPLSGTNLLDAQVERIINQVAMRTVAAARPGPSVFSGPVTINIPIEPHSLNLTRIEVTLTDMLVTVKLCYPGSASPSVVNQQLMQAVAQLGLVMRAQLPGRDVKIVKSISAEEESADETIRAPVASHPFQRIQGETNRDGR